MLVVRLVQRYGAPNGFSLAYLVGYRDGAQEVLGEPCALYYRELSCFIIAHGDVRPRELYDGHKGPVEQCAAGLSCQWAIANLYPQRLAEWPPLVPRKAHAPIPILNLHRLVNEALPIAVAHAERDVSAFEEHKLSPQLWERWRVHRQFEELCIAPTALGQPHLLPARDFVVQATRA